MVRVVEAPTLAAARGDEAVPESGHGELPIVNASSHSPSYFDPACPIGLIHLFALLSH